MTRQVESVVLQDDGDEKLVMAGTLRRLLTLLADQNVSGTEDGEIRPTVLIDFCR